MKAANEVRMKLLVKMILIFVHQIERDQLNFYFYFSSDRICSPFFSLSPSSRPIMSEGTSKHGTRDHGNVSQLVFSSSFSSFLVTRKVGQHRFSPVNATLGDSLASDFRLFPLQFVTHINKEGKSSSVPRVKLDGIKN